MTLNQELVLLHKSSINEVGIKQTLTSKKKLPVSSQGGMYNTNIIYISLQGGTLRREGERPLEMP